MLCFTVFLFYLISQQNQVLIKVLEMFSEYQLIIFMLLQVFQIVCVKGSNCSSRDLELLSFCKCVHLGESLSNIASKCEVICDSGQCFHEGEMSVNPQHLTIDKVSQRSNEVSSTHTPSGFDLTMNSHINYTKHKISKLLSHIICVISHLLYADGMTNGICPACQFVFIIPWTMNSEMRLCDFFFK